MSFRMKGLNQFILKIRACQNKESEQNCVEKEKARIRQKFTGNKALDGYSKKKYIWKLLFMIILGYDVDFGQDEASTLIISGKFSEKYTGYVAASLFISDTLTEIYKKLGNSIRNDVASGNEIAQSLALSLIGTLAPKELVDFVFVDVLNIAFTENSKTTVFIRKKAVLCLLRILRRHKENIRIEQKWAEPIVRMLDHKNIGFLCSAVSLLNGIVALDSYMGYEKAVVKIIAILKRLVISKECSSDYFYYKTPNPWLQVKLLKALQLFPPPPEYEVIETINKVLEYIVTKTQVTKSVNKNNTDYSILFEAVHVIIHYRNAIDPDIRSQASSLLGLFISVKEPNIRYLALDGFGKFSQTDAADNLIKSHLPTILVSLRDGDISIRRRALDILYVMCSPQTSHKIVGELLNYNDEPDPTVKEELTLKVAILAEMFADDLTWYINTVVQLISTSGDYITDDIWHRIVQMITGFGEAGNQNLQRDAASKLLSTLMAANVHETVVKVASYVLAEYGHLISKEHGKEPQRMLDLIQKHWPNCSTSARCMILNAYLKMANKFPSIRDQISSIFNQFTENPDPDLQQRAIEYNKLLDEDNEELEDLRTNALGPMPTYSEEIQTNNPLLRRIYALKMGGSKTDDPTVIHETKRVIQEEMFKSRTFATNAKLRKELSNIGGETEPSKFDSGKAEARPSRLIANPFYEACSMNISKGQNLIKVEGPLQIKQNPKEFKNLITANEGKLYSDAIAEIAYKSEFKDGLGRILFKVNTKGTLSAAEFKILNTSNLVFKILPAELTENSALFRVTCTNNGPGGDIPPAKIMVKVNGETKILDFMVPVTVNKFLQAVEMSDEDFQKYYEEYTHADNDYYYRIDDFIKNPAQNTVIVEDVLAKIKDMLSKGFGLAITKCEDNSFLNAVGSYVYKKDGEVSTLPVMVQVEGFAEVIEGKRYLRISLRGAASGDVIKSLYEILTLFLIV